MDDWNVLDDDEIVATAKALRRLLDGRRLGPAEFALHHSPPRYTVMTTTLPVEPILKTTPTGSPARSVPVRTYLRSPVARSTCRSTIWPVSMTFFMSSSRTSSSPLS